MGIRQIDRAYILETQRTSRRANFFVMLSRRDTTEDAGECIGFHLIYSGNHYEAVEVCP